MEEVRILQEGNPLTGEVCIDGTRCFMVLGTHGQTNYLCVPKWDLGTELAAFRDTFWNAERLRNYCGVDDIRSAQLAAAVRDLALCAGLE